MSSARQKRRAREQAEREDRQTRIAAVGRRWGARGFIFAGMVASIGLVGGLIAWSAVAKLAGAVVAYGQLKVEGARRTVQHPDGGVVERIFVEEGDIVAAGQMLILLDGRELERNLEIIEGQLDELLARQARLRAEAAEREAVEPNPALEERFAARPAARTIFDEERRLFTTRVDTLKRRLEQTEERIAQTRLQIQGAEGQIEAIDLQLSLLADELRDQQRLLRQGNTQKSRVLALQRQEAGLKGDRARLVSEIGRLGGQIAELEINADEARLSRMAEAQTTERDITARIAELRERRLAILQSLARVEIIAPIDGVVLSLAVNTVTGVVTPAAPIMHIVPTGERLVLEARVPNATRDRLHENQEARVLFTTANLRRTPEVGGVISKIGADVVEDERTGAQLFTIEVTVPEAEFERLRASGVREIGPGLPAEVHFQTGSRTAASYILKPFLDSLRRVAVDD